MISDLALAGVTSGQTRACMLHACTSNKQHSRFTLHPSCTWAANTPAWDQSSA